LDSFKEAVQYVQKAAKALYEAAREAFEKVKVTVQRLVELFIEAVTRVLAWIDEHKAYLFLMAAVAAGVIALSAALNLWGLVEIEKLAYAASAPFFAGLADAGGRAAERFRAVAERWRVDENEKQKIEEVVNEVINAPLKGERPYKTLRKLSESGNLPPPLAKLKEALDRVGDEVVQDAAVVAALVLYKTLVKNAEAYGEWAGWYKWARSLVGREEFTVSTGDIKRLREAQRRLEEAAEEVRKELNKVLALYKSHSRDLYERLKQHLEVDLGKAEELAEARSDELRRHSNTNMGTKAYAVLLSIARGGIYGHAAMLLMIEGALADIVLLTPRSAYDNAKDVAKRRGEAVDPSRSRRGAKAGKIAGGRGGVTDQSHVEEWKDRAASVLLRFLIGYGEADPQLLSGAGEITLKFRRVEKRDEKGRVERGFQVFRAYGGVEVFVGELWIGSAVHFNVNKEELTRFVEEAKRTAPDLSGIKKIWQALPWFATDASFFRRRIEAATACLWQAAWYIALFGEPESISGKASVTEEGFKPNVKMCWRREVLDRIIAEEGEELKPLLGPVSKQGGNSREAEGPAVKSWRELVDSIDWSWVLEKVEELASVLKPWIGPEGTSDTEREKLVRRMLGELTLFVHFAEVRRGKNDSEWREERAKRLTKAVEALSGGRIADGYAEELAKAIIYYAEGHKKKAKKKIDMLAKELAKILKEDVDRVKGEVWGVVKFVLGDMYCLARDCARDVVVRKFVEPALELIMLDKALRGEFGREKALLIFGEMYATAVAGDGTVGPDYVRLVVGGELGGGAVLLRLATLYLLNELLPDELKFDARVYLEEGRYYRIAASGEDAARLKRLLAVSAPSAGGEYLSPKFDQFVEEARVEVQVGNISDASSGIAADLIISVGNISIKYNVYLTDYIMLEFESSDRSRVELAARLLKHVGVAAEVKKKEGDTDKWRIRVYTDRLAAGREELRKALIEIVKEAMKRNAVNTNIAERWLEKLEKGRVLMEGWPKFYVRLKDGALEVRFTSTDPDSIEQVAQRLEEMGLKRGVHFTVRMPDNGKIGYVSILKEGLAYAARLSVRGKNKQQRDLADEFVKLILRRAEEESKDVHEKAEEGGDVYEKALEIVNEGKSWGSLRLKGFEKEVEVNGKTYVVRVKGGEAVEEEQNGKTLLRIKIKAEVGRVEDGHIVEREYIITFGRYGAGNKVRSDTYARADPDGREAEAERISALIEALTGKKPTIRRMKDGRIMIVCYGGHLEGFAHYAELADAIEKWLEETSR
jgi:hypothetical protein